MFPGLFILKTDHRKYPRKVFIVLWVSRRWGISMTLWLLWGNIWLLFRRKLKGQFWMIYLFGKPIAYYYSITCWPHSRKCRRFGFFCTVSFLMVFGDNRSFLAFSNFHLECFLGGSFFIKNKLNKAHSTQNLIIFAPIFWRGNITLEFSKNPNFFFLLKECSYITKTRWKHRWLKANKNLKDLNVCETLNAFFSEQIFSIVANWLLQNGCMNQVEFHVAS